MCLLNCIKEKSSLESLVNLFEYCSSCFVRAISNETKDDTAVQAIIASVFYIAIFLKENHERYALDEVSKIWQQKLGGIRSNKYNVYVNSQLSTIDSYLGVGDSILAISTDPDLVSHEISQMAIYTNEQMYSSKNLKEVLRGKKCRSLDTTAASSLLKYTVHTLKSMSYGDKSIIAMRLSWLDRCLANLSQLKRGALTDLRSVLEFLYSEHSGMSRQSLQLIDSISARLCELSP
jgi:hypothetical protein